jgi:hypothetical protein
VPVHRLLAEIGEMGYPGSMNLLYRYITQGPVEVGRPHLSPRRVARLVLLGQPPTVTTESATEPLRGQSQRQRS